MATSARSVPSDTRPPGLAPEGLYVHFPFCVSLCPYCDFVVLAGAAARGPRNRIDALLDGLRLELELRAFERGSPRHGAAGAGSTSVRGEETGPPLASVYLGGGTPSLLQPAQVRALLDAMHATFGVAAGAEVTLEANPGPDEIGDLAGFRAAGVTRLSLGAQSLDAGELRRLGRRHRAEDVGAAVARARDAGFESLSLDLLTDIPGQSLASWRGTLTATLELGADHLSVYSLSLGDPDAEGQTGPTGDHLPVRPGARAWRRRARPEQSEDRAAEMEQLTDELTARAGLRRYEISNLARHGHESRHNLLYWRRRPHLAIGPGAHAFDGLRTRTWNAAPLEAYLLAVRAGRLPPGGRDVVDADTAIAETAILGLRLSEGIDAALARRQTLAPALDWARGLGLAEDVAGRTRLTAAGRLLANEVFERLLPEPRPRAWLAMPASEAASA